LKFAPERIGGGGRGDNWLLYETDLKILSDIIYWFNHYDTLNNWEHLMIHVYNYK
jgi:hypothetical protein